MNTDLLAISNIFAGPSGAGPVPAKAKANKKSEQFSLQTPENKPFNEAHGTETADNALIKSRNQVQNETPEEFSHTFRKEITIDVPHKAKNSRNVQNQNQPPNAAVQPSVVQPLLAQWSLRAELGLEGVAKKVELKAGEFAQLRANLRPETFPSPAGTNDKPNNNEPVPIITQKQNGPKTASPETSKKTLITDIGENGNRIQMPNSGLYATRGPENDQEPLEAHIRAQTRIVTANGKPEAVLISNAFGSEKTPPLAGEEPTPEALVGSEHRIGQQITIGGKSVVPGSQKVPEPNPNILPVQDKSSGLGPQTIRVGLGESALIAENAVYTGAGQPSHLGKQQLSGPLADDVMGNGYNSPGNQAYKNLYRAQFQVFSGPVKGRDGSASNNNSDSGFEQILSGNNAGTYIAEQTLAFPKGVSTDNLPTQTLLSDISASISRQILESINSFPSQPAGNQQITIRLNPPELGRVFIRFEEQENQITGLLEVSKTETRYEIERTLPQIIQNLSDSGIQVKRLEVMLTDQSEQQPYRDQMLQDGSFQQHSDFSEGANSDNPGAAGTNEPGIGGNNSSYHNSLEAQLQITANSINMLV
jgi:hypothetical protein